MGHTAGPGLLALLLTVSSMVAVHGKIHHSRLDMDDRKLVQMTEAFGFAEGNQGRIELSIKDISIWSKHDDESKPNWDNFGFFLWPVEADQALETELVTSDKCVLAELPKDTILLTFRDSAIQKLIMVKDKEKLTAKENPANFPFEVANTGMYSLYFANCEPDMAVSLDSTIQLYNLYHGRKDFLSVGETQLEAVYWVMFSLFTVISGIWAWYVWKNRSHAHRIHYLMGVLCGFKALTLMCQAAAYHFVERTGSADGWNIAYYIFTFFRGTLFFIVVVLIGTGWSYMKPFLGDKEKRILMVVVPLQVFANIAIVVTDEESPSVRDWFTWRDLFHLVDIICCCAILFPIVWSIKHLREASHTDGKAARNLEKLTLFRQFYVMVVVYIYFTRIVVYLLRSTMEYEYTWVSHAAEHFATLAFYVWTAVRFRPQQNNPYLKLETSEIEL